MKALLIGGTGTISSAVTHLALQRGWELYLLNRGNKPVPAGVQSIVADANDEEAVRKATEGMEFDVVAQFIAYTRPQVERDIRLFTGKTKQYIFISSASAYQKPLSSPVVSEGTPLANPYWQYSRDKIECEQALMQAYQQTGFPVTIVRPSHTYAKTSLPVGLYGTKGKWQVIKRMQEGKPVLIHGDGLTLWTMTYNEDFAVGFVGLMGNIRAIGEAVHITSDERLSWNQIYEAIARALNVKLNAVHASSAFLDACSSRDLVGSLLGDKANNAYFDNSKIKALVPEFCATTRFDQGARLCLEYMFAHPETQVEDPEFDDWCDRVVAALERAAAEVRTGK